MTNHLSLGYQEADDRWNVSAGMHYSGRPRLEADYPYYIPSTSLTFSLDAYWRINKSLRLNASINNLTNETYFNFQDVRGRDRSREDILRFSQPERNFQIGAIFSF